MIEETKTSIIARKTETISNLISKLRISTLQSFSYSYSRFFLFIIYEDIHTYIYLESKFFFDPSYTT